MEKGAQCKLPILSAKFKHKYYWLYHSYVQQGCTEWTSFIELCDVSEASFEGTVRLMNLRINLL